MKGVTREKRKGKSTADTAASSLALPPPPHWLCPGARRLPASSAIHLVVHTTDHHSINAKIGPFAERKEGFVLGCEILFRCLPLFTFHRISDDLFVSHSIHDQER
ncbi:UNVERIFIED_CONTAM: hypothetical protein Sradi_5386900 [Sesamum radiatum]|uniref:Uncharacterized protein n=1 Tax=Sesamum radiatum TaxID=300843 RepID=A0AAW2LQ01_SESRA